jgi:PAS domain S-box-containing protein
LPDSSLRTFVKGDVARIALVALACLFVSELPFLFPSYSGLAEGLWTPGGVGLAALLLRPRREWPAILGAVFLAGIALHLQSGGTFPGGAGFNLATVLGLAACAWFITRYCGPDVRFARVKQILALIVSAAVVGGCAALLVAVLAAFASRAPDWRLWGVRCAADGLGILLLAPLIVTWVKPQVTLPGPRWIRAMEWGCFLAVWCGAVWLTLQRAAEARPLAPAPYMLLALLVWPALRFGQRGTTLALVLLVAIACTSRAVTARPLLWGGADPASRLLQVQVHILFAAVAGLLLAAAYAETRSAERSAHEHQARTQRILEETNAAYFRIGLDGCFQQVNQGWLRMHGFTWQQEVVGKHFSVTQVPEDLAKAAEYVARLARGERVSSEFSRLCRDGSVGYHNFSAGPVIEGGRLVGFEGFLVDTTERKRMEMAIEQHEAQLQTIFEAMQDAVLVCDMQGNMVMANKQWASMIGVTEAEAARQNLEAVAGALDWSELDGTPVLCGQGPMSKALRGETFWSWRIIAVKKGTGERRVVSVSGGPACNGGGKQTLAVVVVRDITEHINAEEAVRKAESEYRNIFEGALEGIYRTSTRGRNLASNPAMARMLGYDSAQEVVSAITDSAHQAWADPNERSHFTKLLKEHGVVHGYECRFKRKDGVAIWVSLSTRAVRGPEGETLYYEGFVDDISERKAREEALRESLQKAQRFAEALDRVPAYIYMKNRQRQYVYANRVMLDRFRCNLDELAESKHFPPDTVARLKAMDDRVLEKGETVGEELEVTQDGANPQVFWEMKCPLKNERGEIVALCGIANDITEHKQRAEDVQHMNAELRHLSAELLRSQDAERRRIALELHDSTAQLLAGLGMNLSMLQQSALPPGQARKLFAESASLCAQCSAEIRTMSYLLHPPLLDELGLLPALEQYTLGFKERTGIRVVLDIAPQLGRLGMDAETTLFRITQESLANVHRHSGASEVKIRLQRDERSVRLEVADNGRGFPARVLRGHMASGARLGVGLLGMRERATQLGGYMRLESAGGARIVVNLPIGGPE